MQEEVEQKTFNIVVSTTKLTARTILNAGKAAIQQQQAKMAGGKQSVRMLLRQNRVFPVWKSTKQISVGLNGMQKNMALTMLFARTTLKCRPRYLVLFSKPQMLEAFNAAFKEYSASLLSKTKRPSVLEKLHELVQAAAELPGKVRCKEQERGL